MTEKRKPGRPRRAAGLADERITIRLTKAELKRWTHAAGDQALGDWLRALVERAIGQ